MGEDGGDEEDDRCLISGVGTREDKSVQHTYRLWQEPQGPAAAQSLEHSTIYCVQLRLLTVYTELLATATVSKESSLFGPIDA